VFSLLEPCDREAGWIATEMPDAGWLIGVRARNDEFNIGDVGCTAIEELNGVADVGFAGS
jgi:hypothetical protein